MPDEDKNFGGSLVLDFRKSYGKRSINVTFYFRLNHKDYNFLECDWFKKAPIFHLIDMPSCYWTTWIRSDEGLTLETSAFESLYGGQFTLSTQLMKPNYLVILPTDAAPQFR